MNFKRIQHYQMMKTKLLIATLALVGMMDTQSQDNGKWVDLFDGKTLNGWKQRGGKAKYTNSFQLDRDIFGADRSTLLKSIDEGGLATRVLNDASFGLMRPGIKATYLGALSAENEASGTTIARDLIECAPTAPIFWDLPDANEHATSLAEELSFEAKRDLLRMYLGDNDRPGKPLKMFGISEPGLG